MANYNYYEFQNRVLSERFPSNQHFIGINEWESFLNEPSLNALNRIRAAGATKRQKCPRIFVSHRSTDIDFAFRIANLATIENFEFWLDVLDPNLSSIRNSTILPAYLIDLITAGIIEMALINCTHVIAVMTPNSSGSMWIPYEYGRITDIPIFLGRAGAWLQPNVNLARPEYLLLGVIAQNEGDIRSWLSYEMKQWNGLCPPVHWNYGNTVPLP